MSLSREPPLDVTHADQMLPSSCGSLQAVSSPADEDVFVQAVPIITTITKHAEISQTDKFVSTKKVNLSVNAYPHLLTKDIDVNLHQEPPSRSRSKRAGFYWSDVEEPLVDAGGQQPAGTTLLPPSQEQIYGTKPKKRTHAPRPGDSSGISSVLLSEHSMTTMDDDSQHRKLLAERVVHLTNQVLDSQNDDLDFVPHLVEPVIYGPRESSPQHSKLSAEATDISTQYSVLFPSPSTTQTSEYSLSSSSSELPPQYSQFNRLFPELSSQHSHMTVVAASNISSAQDRVGMENVKLDYNSDTISSQLNLDIQQSDMLSPTVSRLAFEGEKRKVLTNGSLMKRIAASDNVAVAPALSSTQPEVIPSSALFQNVEKDHPDSTSTSSDLSRKKITSSSDCSKPERPNTLDLTKDGQTEMISSLIRTTPDIVVTPTQTPKSCGLVNPGFVFEFPPSPEKVISGKRPAASPSLLDVLHKKYWANSSPNSSLTRKHTPKDEGGDDETSAFRSRHASYCRVVDQNTNEGLGFQTLPSNRSKNSPTTIRMFGDVSKMFSTLPVRSSPEHRQRTTSESGKTSTHADKQVNGEVPTAKLSTLSASLAPSVPATTSSSSSKLTRKFSLSPRVIRRKIIARLQQETDKTGSSESETEDLLTLSKLRNYKNGLHAKKKQDMEIEALEACTWLEQAGFPQYVQLFEDSQLPIDLQSVEKDHSFLDQQQLQSLFRRLNTLNNSIHMKLDINNKKQLYVRGGEEEEEETCVLSDKWHFEKSSGRWSHIDAASHTAADTSDSAVARMRSCSSRDSVMTDATAGEGDDTGGGSSPPVHSKHSVNNNHLLNVKMVDHDTGSPASTKAQPNSDNQSKQSKQRGGNFFQRHVGSLNKRVSQKASKRDKSASSANGVPLISGPTLVNTPDMTERMQKLGCIDINKKDDGEQDLFNNCNNNCTSKSLIRSASADAATHCHSPCDCDTYSIDSSLTEYMLPDDYILGTFPKELLASHVPSRQNSISSVTKLSTHNKCSHSLNGNEVSNQNTSPNGNEKTTTNRHSVYDNLPLEDDFILPDVEVTDTNTVGRTSSTSEARRELDAVLKDLLYNITNLDLDSDDVSSNLLFSKEQRLSGLSILSAADHAANAHLQVDSAIVSPGSEELSSLPVTPTDTPLDTPVDTPLDTPADTPELKRSITGSTHRDLLTSNEELCGSRENIAEAEDVEADDGSIREMQETIWRERRDSGVGSSLTREPLEKKKKVRLRWHSFVASHRPSFNSQSQQISSLSAGQLMYLRRLALLKLTSLMEQYSPSHKSGFSLQLVNKFMKKTSRTPDYQDKKLFGVPLSVMLQRTGQPLPQCILHAMRYLRKSAPHAVGIFRKPGVKSRIQKLRNDLDSDPDNVAQFDSMQSFDVADMFKQYLRELPECLVTNKLSETFLAIYQHFPQDLRLEALQACSLLLPDENREVLESLLYFLSDMASYHEENQMTASNLAMCFAPSLFNIHGRMAQSKSPKSVQKNVGGLPDQKEFQDQKSATDCLTSMIVDCKKVFRIPEDFLSKCSSSSSYMEAGEPAPLSLLAVGATSDYHSHIDSCVKGLLKESKDKAWTAVPSVNLSLYCEDSSVDVSYKKVHDNNPLRLWKCSTEIEAPPSEVLNRVLNERQKWDEDLLKWRTVEKLDTDLDIFQFVRHSMAPQPCREYLILRAWKQDLPKGACALVMHSIDHEVTALGGGIRGIILASHYLIEPCGSGKSKLTYISRIDGRGRQAKWYNRSYGSLAANTLLRIKESFNKPRAIDIHETKV